MALMDCKVLRAAVVGSALAFVGGISLQLLATLPVIQSTLLSSLLVSSALFLVLCSPLVLFLAVLISLIPNANLEHCQH